MLCPTCNQEISFTGVCPRCGVVGNSTALQAAGDPFAGSRPQLPAAKRARLGLVIFGFVMWVVVIGIAFLQAKLMGQGKPVRDTQGFFVGALIFPAFVAVVVTAIISLARKSKLSPAQKHFWAGAIALIVSFMAFAGASQQRHRFRHTDPKKEMARLLAEASGKSPVSSNSDWWDGLMRDFFRSIIERNKRYTQEIREFDNSALKHLYSPESYSTRAGMQKTIDQLQATLQLDQKYGTVRPLIEDMERRLRTVDASEGDKESFLEGVKSSSEVFLGSQDKLLDLEKKWVDASVVLYQFTIEYRADYAIEAKKLVFKNDAARLEFVAKQNEAIAQRRAFLDEKSGLDRMRNNMMTEIGLASNGAGQAPSPGPAKEPAAPQ